MPFPWGFLCLQSQNTDPRENPQSHKDLPVQFLASPPKTLSASLIIASFGTSDPYRGPAFDIKIELDPSAPPPAVEKPLRYGKLPEIHHIFKPDPKSPPKIITLFFTGLVIAALPLLLVIVSFFVLVSLCALLIPQLPSGSHSARTSTTRPKLLEAHLTRMPHSSYL